MYFAVDPTNRSAVHDTLLEAGAHFAATTNLLALLDLAFDHGASGRSSRSWWQTPVPVYSELAMEPLVELSPVLLRIDHRHPDRFLAQVDSVIDHCSGRPMLSFVATDLSRHALCDFWRPYLNVACDNQSFVLRFADTRALASLPAALEAKHWRALHAGVHQWWFIDRQGGIQLLSPPRAADDGPPPKQISLSTAELTNLLVACDADTLIDALHTHLPETLPDLGSSALYRQVFEVCELARRQGVDVYADKFTLAVAVLTGCMRPADPDLVQLLSEKTWQTGKLGEGLNRLFNIREYGRAEL